MFLNHLWVAARKGYRRTCMSNMEWESSQRDGSSSTLLPLSGKKKKRLWITTRILLVGLTMCGSWWHRENMDWSSSQGHHHHHIRVGSEARHYNEKDVSPNRRGDPRDWADARCASLPSLRTCLPGWMGPVSPLQHSVHCKLHFLGWSRWGGV